MEGQSKQITIRSIKGIKVIAVCNACMGNKGEHRSVIDKKTKKPVQRWYECSTCKGKGELEEYMQTLEFIHALKYQEFINANDAVNQQNMNPVLQEMQRQWREMMMKNAVPPNKRDQTGKKKDENNKKGDKPNGSNANK